MSTYSHSKLSTFEQCKHKYKLQYIDKIKVEYPTTIEAFMGSCVHEALEKLYKDLKFTKLNTIEDLIKFYEHVWEKEWSDDIIIVKEYSKENYKDMGRKFLRGYYKEYFPFNEYTILGLETEDKLRLSDGSLYHVRIDKLACRGSVYYVCDYKTNSKMKSQEEADKDRQLALYSLWVRNHFKDARHVVLVWHMLAFNKEMTSERTSEELKKLEKETIELIKEIESTKEFPASVSTLCDYCVYKNYCPSFRHETLIESKPIKQFEKDEGVKLVNSFAVLKEKEREVEEELTLVKDDLILFSKQEKIDVIYGSNKKVSVKEYEKFIIEDENKQKAEELLKKHGLFEQFTLVSWAKLNSQIAEDNIPKDIAKLAKKEKDYRVSLSKKKEEEE